MAARVDRNTHARNKKSRPYLKCGSCGSIIIFARCGDLGIATLLEVADRIDLPTANAVREGALATIRRGPTVSRMSLEAQQHQTEQRGAAANTDLGKVA